MTRGPLLRQRAMRMPGAGEVEVPIPTIEKSREAAGMRNMWGRKEHVFTSWRRRGDPYTVICFTWPLEVAMCETLLLLFFLFLILLFLLVHLILLNLLLLLLLLLLLHLILLKSRLSITSPNAIRSFFWLLCPRNELRNNVSIQVRGSWRDCCICISFNEAVSNRRRSIESHLRKGSDRERRSGWSVSSRNSNMSPPPSPPPNQIETRIRSASGANVRGPSDRASDYPKAAPIIQEATWPPGINKERI